MSRLYRHIIVTLICVLFSGGILSVKAAYVIDQQQEIVVSADTVQEAGSEDPAANFEDEQPTLLRKYSSYIITHFRKSPLLITILYIVIFYSIITLITLLIFILINRSRMERESRIREMLRENFQQQIMDYLFDPAQKDSVLEYLVEMAADKFTRQELINQMIDLSVNLKGEIKERIKDLYLKLGLKRDSLEKARSRKWHENIKGFRELAFMNIREANEDIIKALNSPNEILRMEAQIALVRLSDDNPYHFLNFMERPFSLWEQLSLHELVIQHNLNVPDFSQWFHSENLSIVIFALRMVSWFKQRDAEKGVIKLLEHENEDVRYAAIRVIGQVGMSNALESFKEIYEKEGYKNRLEILRSFAKVPDERHLDFLKGVLDMEEDVQLQIQATKAMENTDEPGISLLIKLMKSKSEYKNYQIIIRHVLDGRIY